MRGGRERRALGWRMSGFVSALRMSTPAAWRVSLPWLLCCVLSLPSASSPQSLLSLLWDRALPLSSLQVLAGALRARGRRRISGFPSVPLCSGHAVWVAQAPEGAHRPASARDPGPRPRRRLAWLRGGERERERENCCSRRRRSAQSSQDSCPLVEAAKAIPGFDQLLLGGVHYPMLLPGAGEGLRSNIRTLDATRTKRKEKKARATRSNIGTLSTLAGARGPCRAASGAR